MFYWTVLIKVKLTCREKKKRKMDGKERKQKEGRKLGREGVRKGQQGEEARDRETNQHQGEKGKLVQ